MAGLYEAPSLSTIKVGQFKGSDSSAPEDQIKAYRAARSENMIPDAAGEVCKRPGVQFEKAITVGGTVVEVIDGKHLITLGIENLYQYDKSSVIWSEQPVYRLWYYNGSEYINMAASASQKPLAIRYGSKTIVFCRNGGAFKDGTEYGAALLGSLIRAMVVVIDEGKAFAYDSDGRRWGYDASTNTFVHERTISDDDDFLTTPIIVNGCNPSGGGNAYQKVNLLNPWVTESFCCKDDKNALFYLNSVVSESTDGNEKWRKDTIQYFFRVEVLVPIEEGEGEHTQTVLKWSSRTFGENDAFRPSMNRLWLAPEDNGGCGTYEDSGNHWIGASPTEGEDNVRITHWRSDFEEKFVELCECVCGTTFGVGGYKDRLVIGGGNQQKNRIYYSEIENPFYIGDLNFIETEAGSSVMAVDGTDDALAILTDKGIYFSQATAQNNADDVLAVSDALFTVSAKIPAPAPINIGNTAVLGGEIVYLSAEGVIAVAYKEHFDTRFAEHRSALIDRVMLADQPQQLVSLGRFLMIRCAGGVWWLLDENQPNNEGDKPYSSHQYEGFRLTGMEADAAWAEGDTLKLIKGTAQCQWMDGSLPEHYHDNYTDADANEKAITAWWETPYIYGSSFYRKKIFMKLGLLLGQLSYVDDNGVASIADTAVLVEGKKNEEAWKVLWPYDGTLCSFDYGNIDYRLFTYASDPGCPDISRKIKIKKAQRFKLRFTNDFINQPFILREFGLDYVQED